MDKREAAKQALALLVDRMREDSLDAVLALGALEKGILVLGVPRSTGRPVEASIVSGGLQLRLFEDRELAGWSTRR